jgi:hypothetical protein
VGCAGLQTTSNSQPDLPNLPSKRQIRVGTRYLIVTDVELAQEHPLFRELEGLSEQICRELQLPPSYSIITIYLFKDQPQYTHYMKSHFKLPSRPAFFMARGEEMFVYTSWGDRIQEDLRHELTHAEIHSTCKNVPMWLDEGLAEFFETPPQTDGVNYRHLNALRRLEAPWQPNLRRLEKATQLREMGSAEYCEAWAWVHFLLRGSAQAKPVLLAYLQQLRAGQSPAPFEPLLNAALPKAESQLAEHIDQVNSKTRSLDLLPGLIPPPLPPKSRE